MAMIPCKECGQRLSDRATRCPACGAPTGTPDSHPDKAGARSWWLPLLGLWCIALASWFVMSSHGRAELRAMVGSSAPASRTSSARPATGESSAPVAASAAVAVLETSAEQLFQDYGANAVALQDRISGRRLRVRGVVTAVDEDASGRALVRLRTGPGTSADFRLEDAQKSAAAKLVKGQAVNVDCAGLQHGASAPLGTGCALVPIEPTGKASYLAVLYPVEHGQSPLYIVGPLTESACAERGDRIAGQLSPGGQSVSKKCAATAQESMPSDECRLDTSMSSLPDLPDAHLWRYHCVAHGAALGRASVEKKTPPRRAVASAAVLKASRVAPTPVTAPAPEPAAEIETPTPLPDPTPVPASANSTVVAPAPLPTVDVTPAATGPAAGSPVQAAPAADPSPVVAPASDVTEAALPPDLATVSAKDPSAATRINTYCGGVTAAAANKDTVALGCRREETAAWNRFTVQNEFPNLDDTARQKCSQPPFPDSYVAKEACAKYQLRIN